MGSDNLYHRRKAKTQQELQRRKALREPYLKVLIVCEGQKTEPIYFQCARDYYRLSAINVEVRGDCSTDPMQIYEFARTRYLREKNEGDSFDKVFCVFDQDGHSSYNKTIRAISEANPKDTFFAIHSAPCFEYWLLLHFCYTTKPYTALPKKSTGEQVLNDLLDYMPKYKKGYRAVFSDLFAMLPDAKLRAERGLRQVEKDNASNPSTRVHELMNILQGMKR